MEGLADILQDETIGDAREIDACDVYACFSVEGPEWIQELRKRLQAIVGSDTLLALRGASFDNPPWHLQLWAQTRAVFPAGQLHIDKGFRLAKSCN
jgi:hypothetical protein